MSFFRFRKEIQNENKYLQHYKYGQKALVRSPVILHFLNVSERTSCQALAGNMTVEAALALPLFLFAMVNLLSLILMFQTFSGEEARLHQAGRELSMLSYGQEEGEQDIRLVKVSRVKAVVPVAAFSDAVLVNGCVMHKWTGYDLEQSREEGVGEKEEMVYITRAGEAYHRERSCIYLNPSIRMLPLAQAQDAVNQDGQHYTPCESCGGNSTMVYVTEAGIRYHSSVTCSGLRRTVESVTLQKALELGRHACPRCG